VARSKSGHQKSGKASFDHIYNLEDPREYYNTLGGLGYAAPEHGCRLFSALVDARRAEKEAGGESGPVKIVDVCCSYGINAALLKHEVTLDDLYERYGSEEVSDLSGEELARADAAFYAERLRNDAPVVVGLDVADNAVSYALRAGILDAGFSEDLEGGEPSGELSGAVEGADLVVVTGGIGYVTERTFERLLDRVRRGGGSPWVAALALRWVSYESVSGVLQDHGLATERLEGHTLVQRRFADRKEHEYVVGELRNMGIDPEGKESEGAYHDYFYLSRPEARAASEPVEELLRSALRDS
jgi:SAM-dependent methyltransferase